MLHFNCSMIAIAVKGVRKCPQNTAFHASIGKVYAYVGGYSWFTHWAFRWGVPRTLAHNPDTPPHLRFHNGLAWEHGGCCVSRWPYDAYTRLRDHCREQKMAVAVKSENSCGIWTWVCAVAAQCGTAALSRHVASSGRKVEQCVESECHGMQVEQVLHTTPIMGKVCHMSPVRLLEVFRT